MDYESFYGFKKEPFSDTPDPSLFYSGPEHSRAFIKLLHIIKRGRGLGILTGEVGCGKSTLARKLLSEMSKDKKLVNGLMILTHSDFEVEWFLKNFATLFGIEINSSTKSEMIGLIIKYLYNVHKEGRHCILVIDEANNISTSEMLEEIRGLLNLELSGSRLITFILCGMPVMMSNLKTNTSLFQRISSIIKLPNLSFNSTRDYIKFRTKQCGVENDVFTPKAIEYIYKYSRGIPRMINVICDNALLEGSIIKKNPVDEAIINRVCEDLGIE
uniref:AAA family ATPase n=1 Tax=candidate division WOR-3 bacterium TaxID=2052148 RepID=A0A7C4YHI6_UNCW3